MYFIGVISMRRAQVLTWAVVVLTTFCASLMTRLVRFDLVIDRNLVLGAGFVASLVALHGYYTILRPAPILASITGSLAAILWSIIMVAIISLAGLGFHAPLIDEALIRLDAGMGINVADIVIWTSNYPKLASALDVFYASSTILILISVAALALTNQHERLWLYCFRLCGSALVCTLLSSLVPAIGSFKGLNILAAALARLPAGSGIYAVESFEAHRNGSVRIIDLTHMVAGVVTFPSFHFVMALTAIYAFRTIRFCAWPAYLWNSVVIFSTIPIGGHYVTDLIAGAVVWSAFARFARSVDPSSRAVAAMGAKSGLGEWIVPERRPHWNLEFVAQYGRGLWGDVRFHDLFNGKRDRLRN
jgi:membrane-associated phospholipid phosphatase